MATVSELCDALAVAIGMAPEEVKKFARALINSGDLPKATGRSIPETDMRHRAKLILAIAASERPADCVKAMQDRYTARARFRETDLTAGEVLANELAALANKEFPAFQKWMYSRLEVSRNGMPRVQFRINENIKHYEDAKKTSQPEFLGGPWLAGDLNQTEKSIVEFQTVGLPVQASVPGDVLIVAAFGSKEAAKQATKEVIRTYQRSKAERVK